MVLIFIREKLALSFLSGEMENKTKLFSAYIISRFTLEVVYFIHNNIKIFKNPDFKRMIHTDELQMENNY